MPFLNCTTTSIIPLDYKQVKVHKTVIAFLTKFYNKLLFSFLVAKEKHINNYEYEILEKA